MKHYYSKRNHASRSYLALAIATALSSGLVLAEEAVDASPAAQEKGLERIEVTARKTVETLQSVPAADHLNRSSRAWLKTVIQCYD